MQAEINYTETLKGTIKAPPSKNYTTRYILVSCLAEDESKVHNPADSDDARALIECCRALGAQIIPEGRDLRIIGFGRSPQNPGSLNPHNAGAVLRFLLGISALLPEIRLVTDYPDSLGERPNQDLLDALGQMGVKSESAGGRLPITLYGGCLHGGEVKVSGKISSQYLSSLLFLAPLVGEDVRIKVTEGLKSRPLIRTTLEVLEKAGIEVKARDDLLEFFIPAGQRYKSREYYINGDYPGAAAILCAGAVTSSEITIDELYQDQQGEGVIVNVLRQMGAQVEHRENQVKLKSSGQLKPVEFDGDKATDAVLAMVGAACFAHGRSRFYNVENLRYKECDRITEPLQELEKIGVRVEEKRDEIIIYGQPQGYEGGLEVSGRGDHRVIMLLAIVGLGCRQGLTIHGAEQVAKSYPDFFADLQSLGAKVKLAD